MRPAPPPTIPGLTITLNPSQPTGLTNSASTAVSTYPQGTPTARKAVNKKYLYVFPASGLVNGPSIAIAPGWSVSIRAHNGVDAGNQHVCKVATSYEELGGSQTETITPDTEITFPVDNLHQIWASGTAGDGIIISVRAGNT